MKIAFVHADVENFGLEYLAAVLKREGHQVDLFFEPQLFGSSYAKAGSAKRFFSFENQIVRSITRDGYHLVCFSAFSDRWGWALGLAQKIKEGNSRVLVVFGGVHATLLPEHVISQRCIDYVCVGEGEQAFLDLVTCLEERGDDTRIPNIWSKKNGTVARNDPRPLLENLDSLPFPDKKIFYDAYPHFSERYMIIASRGCPYCCTFCVDSYLKTLYKGAWGHVRWRSVESVIEELRGALRDYRPRYIMFFDETFGTDIQWLEKFAREYSASIRLPYFCLVHPHFITKESTRLLELSGCREAFMGIQSIHPGIKKNILHRHETPEQVQRAVALFRKSKISLSAASLFGLPTQTEKDMLDEISFYNDTRVEKPSILWLRYYPKIAINDIAHSYGCLSNEDIRFINEDTGYHPYAAHQKSGFTYNKRGAQLITALFFVYLLPRALGSFFLKKKLYKYMPVHPAFSATFFLLNRCKTLLLRKKPGLQTPFMTYIKFYLYFMLKKLASFFKKTVPARKADR